MSLLHKAFLIDMLSFYSLSSSAVPTINSFSSPTSIGHLSARGVQEALVERDYEKFVIVELGRIKQMVGDLKGAGLYHQVCWAVHTYPGTVQSQLGDLA